MKQAVLVSKEKDQFQELSQMLNRNNIDMKWVDSGKALLSQLSEMPAGQWVDLVVTEEQLADMDAKALVEAVIAQSPMTNCAVAGTMEKKKFHDVYEGYGVLMQLPPTPGQADADLLEDHLKKIRVIG